MGHCERRFGAGAFLSVVANRHTKMDADFCFDGATKFRKKSKIKTHKNPEAGQDLPSSGMPNGFGFGTFAQKSQNCKIIEYPIVRPRGAW